MRFLPLLIILCLCPAWAQPKSALDNILERGEIRVGTTGDYAPFSVLKDGGYTGFDIRLAEVAAQQLGVTLRFVPTTWTDLVGDLEADKFDIAVGGITRTLPRSTRAGFSRPTFVIGKCPLVRASDRARFQKMSDIDRPDVKVAVNPGGTNERYVRHHLRLAQIVAVEDNLAIPQMIAEGRVDVMLTDNLEAVRAVRLDPRLAAPYADEPWTIETLGLLTPRDDQALINWLNLLLEQLESDGTLQQLQREFELPARIDLSGSRAFVTVAVIGSSTHAASSALVRLSGLMSPSIVS